MSVVNQIKHYQRSIEKCTEDQSKVLHCIEKLYKLAVTVQHLQDTGVGRTVNGLRKYEGAVGDAAKALVAKWKTMVVDEESSECDDEDETANNQEPPEGYSDNSDSLDKDAASKKTSSSSSSSSRNHHSPKEKENRNTSRHESRHSKHSKTRDQVDSEPSSDDKKKSTPKRDEKRRETSSSSSSATKQSDSLTKKSLVDPVTKLNGDDKKDRKRKHSVTGVDSEKRRKHSETPEQSTDYDADKSPDCDKVKKTKTSTSREPEKREKSSKDKHRHSSSSSKSSKSEKLDDDKKNRRDKKSSSKDRHKKSSSSSSSSSSRDEKKKDKKKFNNGDDGGIDCNSGASFAEALGMCAAPSSSKKSKIMSPCVKTVDTKERKTKEIKTEQHVTTEEQPLSLLAPNVKLPPLVSSVDLAATLPETNPNYKPLPNNYMNMMNKKDEESKAMSEVIYTKNQRTKVYSGNKSGYTSVPSLYEICIRVLIENIEALEVTGGVPFDIIKPVLERATPDQLFMLEHYNPYLIEDTDALWKFHCTKEFRSKEREEMESWREMYMRCLDEREAKLKALTANINKSKIEKSLPVRSTKLAYVDNIVKPPRNVLRKQAKYGTSSSSETTSDLKKKLLIAGVNSATNISVPPPPMSRMKSSSSAVVKKNKAPLMAKALQLIKGRYKR